MQINQHNYETFFLMYVDNELSVHEKEIVEAFVKQHPELAGELELLKQTVVGLDETIEFENREKLIKKQEITEEDLLTYLDGEAGEALAGKIEKEVTTNDTLKRNLEDLGKLYLKADLSIQYPAKEKLYKSAVVRRLDWRKLAIAASLLVCVSTWLVLNQSDQEELNEGRVADNRPTVSQPASTAPAIVDTNTNADTNIIAAVPPSEDDRKNKGKGNTAPGKTNHSPVVQPSLPKPGVSKENTPTATQVTTVNEIGNKTNPNLQSVEPVKETIESITKSSSIEQSGTVASVKEPEAEKKSLFKKLGKKISDRALDILSDGGDNINVAGFAIRLEK